jgi:integrase
MATFQKRSGLWRAIIRKKDPYSGRLVTETKGGFDSKPEAQEWALEREKAIKRGTHASVAEAEAMTLKEALEKYERDVTPYKKGEKQEKVRIGAWKKDPLAFRTLASLRGADIASWRDERLAAKKSPTTVRNDLALISHLFTVAAKEWGMESLSNPVQKIKLPAAGRARDRRLDPAPDKTGKTEYDLLLAACEARPAKWLAPLVRLALATAMRQSELLALQWENIDREKRFARLVDTKNGEARDVPLSTGAIATLEEMLPPVAEGVKRLPPRGAVFEANTDQVVYEFKMARRAAGIAGLRFHDLRHEATSRLFEKGLNPMEAASVTHERMERQAPSPTRWATRNSRDDPFRRHRGRQTGKI